MVLLVTLAARALFAHFARVTARLPPFATPTIAPCQGPNTVLEYHYRKVIVN